MRLVRKGIAEPKLRKFYIFMFLMGIVQPQFDDFRFLYFTKDMKISMVLFNFVPIVAGFTMIIFPFIYIKYLKNTEYRKMFFIIQLVLFIITLVTLVAAMKWNRAINIPDQLIFVVSFLLNGGDKAFNLLTSDIIIAKLTPPGIEGSLVALSQSIYVLNEHAVR